MTSVTEAARELLGLVGAAGHCHSDPANGWHMLTGARHPAENCPACALRSTIAAEEERQKVRRHAAGLFLREDRPENIVDLTPNPEGPSSLAIDVDSQVALREWANMETSP